MASSSSTSADRNPTRSVASVSRRRRSPARAIVSTWAAARPCTRSVASPRTTSRKCADRRARRPPAGLGAPLRLPSDQHHEHRDERERDRQDERGGGVARERPGEDRRRHQGRERDLREVGGEVRLQRIDALDGRGGELAAPLAGQCSRARMQQVVHEPPTQLGHHARGADPAGRLEAGGDEAARQRDDHEPDQPRPDVGERGAAEEGVRDHRGEQRRLRDHEGGLGHPEGDRGGQVRARRPARPGQPPPGRRDGGAVHEPWCSRRSSGVRTSPKSSGPIRRRNTQYVQAW